MTMDKAIEEFEADMRIRNLSERTIETYGLYVRRFRTFLREHYPRVTSWERVTKEIALDYQRYVASIQTDTGEHLANQTQITMLRSVRRMYAFLMKRDLVLRDPTTAITPPKEEQRIVRNTLTRDETFALLRHVKPRTPISLRNRAIVELLYSCGMRTSELCSLKVRDVDLKEHTVTIVRGKGKKSRIVPIGQYAAHYVQEYVERARKRMLKGRRDDPGNLFLSNQGNPFNKSTINATVMRSVTRDLGLEKHISCYSFRHSVATQLLQNKVDIMYIAKLLGHASLRTTQRYLRVEIEDLKRVHSLCHPREAGRDPIGST